MYTVSILLLVHSANAFSLSYYGWGLEDDDVNTCSQRFSPFSQRALTVLPWLGP